MVIRFADATPDANNNYRFVFKTPIPGVIYAEWMSASSGLIGKAVFVNELDNDGQTTSLITPVSVPPSNIAPYSPSDAYNVGDLVTYGAGLYQLKFALRTMPIIELPNVVTGNLWWISYNGQPLYDPNTVYRLFDIVEFPAMSGVMFKLTNPASYPAKQPEPGTGTAWTPTSAVPVYSPTELYTYDSANVAGSVIWYEYTVGSFAYFLLSPVAPPPATVQPPPPVQQPVPVSSNWSYQGSNKPNPNVKALPTSSAQYTGYWRYIFSNVNYSRFSIGENQSRPRDLTFLNVKVFDLDGTPVLPTSENYLEIFFWSKV